MLSECSPGFRGWNCFEMCPENYYGRKCLTKCRCKETQICHHVCGCLQRLDLDNSNMKKNGTSIFFKERDVFILCRGVSYYKRCFIHRFDLLLSLFFIRRFISKLLLIFMNNLFLYCSPTANLNYLIL